MGGNNPTLRSLRWVYVFIGALLLIMSSMIGYGYSIGDRFHTLEPPVLTTLRDMAAAAGECYRQVVVMTHTGGEPISDLETPIQPLDLAFWHFRKMLAPDTSVTDILNLSKNARFIKSIEALEAEVIIFKNASSRLLGVLAASVDARPLVAQYEDRYLALLQRVNEVEGLIIKISRGYRSRFRYTMAGLTGICIALAFVVGAAVRRYEKRKARHWIELNRAMADLKQEIAERKDTEKALKESEQRFRTAFETSPDGMIITRVADSTIVDVNQSFTAQTGFDREAVIGRSALELKIWHDLRQRERFFADMNRSDAVRNWEAQFRLPDGRLRDNLLSAKFIDIGGERHLLAVARDVTELKESEAALKESEEKFRSLFESASDFILLLDLQGRILLANRALLQRLGYLTQEVTGRHLLDFMDASSREYFHQAFPSIYGQKDIRSECRLAGRDGVEMSVAYSAAAVRDAGGVVQCAVVVMKDISRRKLYEDKIQASIRFLGIANRYTEMRPLLREFLAEIKTTSRCHAAAIRIVGEDGQIPYAEADGFTADFCSLEGSLSIHSDKGMCVRVIQGQTDPHEPFFTPHGSYWVNSTTRFLESASDTQKDVMRHSCHRFGFESLALIPIRAADQVLGLIHIASKDPDKLTDEVIDMLEAAALQLGTAIQRVRVEEALKQSHAELEKRVEKRTEMLSQANEQLLKEIEERKRTEQALLQYQERLRSLSSELIQTQEQERRLIATEIHDRIGQALAVAKIKLGGLRATLAAGDASAAVEEIRDIVTQTIRDTRTLTFELSPPVLYELGLKPALEWLSEFIRKQSALPVTVACDGAEERLNIHQRVILFRAVRELFYNIVKHAGASAAQVRIQGLPEGIQVVVVDDGAGFDPRAEAGRENGAHPGFGLFSIREQLQYYGGRLDIASEPGQGTRVTIFLPLEA